MQVPDEWLSCPLVLLSSGQRESVGDVGIPIRIKVDLHAMQFCVSHLALCKYCELVVHCRRLCTAMLSFCEADDTAVGSTLEMRLTRFVSEWCQARSRRENQQHGEAVLHKSSAVHSLFIISHHLKSSPLIPTYLVVALYISLNTTGTLYLFVSASYLVSREHSIVIQAMVPQQGTRGVQLFATPQADTV